MAYMGEAVRGLRDDLASLPGRWTIREYADPCGVLVAWDDPEVERTAIDAAVARFFTFDSVEPAPAERQPAAVYRGARPH